MKCLCVSSFCTNSYCSPATNVVTISVVLTVLVLPTNIFGRNLFEGETLITPEVLSEFTEVITETTNDLGFEANVTQPARLGKLDNESEMYNNHVLSSLSLSLSLSLSHIRWLCF